MLKQDCKANLYLISKVCRTSFSLRRGRDIASTELNPISIHGPRNIATADKFCTLHTWHCHLSFAGEQRRTWSLVPIFKWCA